MACALVRYTHAATVNAVVTGASAVPGTVTTSLTPSNCSAPPRCPAVQLTPFSRAPLLPCPETSPATVPLPSSNGKSISGPSPAAVSVVAVAGPAAPDSLGTPSIAVTV